MSRISSRISFAYGDKEPLAYVREAEDYANELESVGCNVTLIAVSEANHFDMINELANVEKKLFRMAMGIIFKR